MKAELTEALSDGMARILKIFKDSEYEFPVQDGFEYQVLICASHDFKRKELIRVEVIVEIGSRWEHTEYDFIAVAELKALNTKAER